MGHRLSKTTISGSNVATNKSQRKRNSTKIHTTAAVPQSLSQSDLNNSTNKRDLGPTINVITDTQHFRFETRTDPNISTNGPRQIVIKIQLAKMETGENDDTSAATTTLRSSPDGAVTGSNNNLNVERSNLTVNAISFRRNIACDQGNEIKLNNLNVGPSVMLTNNNFVSNFTSVPYIEEDSSDVARNWTNVQNFNIMVRQMGNCQILDNATDSRQGGNNNDSGSNRSSTSSSEFNDVMPEIVKADINKAECSSKSGTRTTMCLEGGKNHCCLRKKSSSSSATTSSSAYPSKWRCCKCTCRDALKKFRPSKRQSQNLPTSNNSEMQPLAGVSSSSHEIPPTTGSHLAIWSPANDVIIPLASPQIVVVQYPPASAASHLVTLGPIANLDEHAIRLMTGDLVSPTTPDSPSSMAASPCSSLSAATTPNGTVVHSQVDYIHCLVPDLERITKSTFYWGKMDRYEAERLLEGKPEGTFLLRDSAQEEYLFSVTFRKYERSLHARIEQFNHRFSFDCHDPGVFTASTVTGLLEHYKDPSCVMFFEPMLTIPLHRNTTFTLQQLCRATVVSNTTYDGITELEIPTRLKSYLKEYHYKQRVRVKPFDEPFYSCT